VPPVHWGETVAARQIAAHLGVELVVLEQAVELYEDGVSLVGQFGHAGKDIFGRVAVNEHAGASSAD
jgi:hypothetical protein